MAHSNLTDSRRSLRPELAGRWVAVSGDGSSLPSGAVLVDYDTELDLLCQRVAAAGQSGLTIYLYPDPSRSVLGAKENFPRTLARPAQQRLEPLSNLLRVDIRSGYRFSRSPAAPCVGHRGCPFCDGFERRFPALPSSPKT